MAKVKVSTPLKEKQSWEFIQSAALKLRRCDKCGRWLKVPKPLRVKANETFKMQVQLDGSGIMLAAMARGWPVAVNGQEYIPKPEPLSQTEKAQILVVEGGFSCCVWVNVGMEGWRFRTRKCYIQTGDTAYSREEALMLALWDALDLCGRMGWTPGRPKWVNATERVPQ